MLPLVPSFFRTRSYPLFQGVSDFTQGYFLSNGRFARLLLVLVVGKEIVSLRLGGFHRE